MMLNEALYDDDRRPRVALVVGYFDWFSGYQETALAAALSKIADVEVICSDRVSPAFSSEHLRRLNLAGQYEAGTTFEHGVTITRLPCMERRSMLWSRRATSYMSERQFDLCIQVMPGQILPVAASVARAGSQRVVLYGDNRAMYEGMSTPARAAKWMAFLATKGLIYSFVNSRATKAYGYTPNTLRRLRWSAPITGLSLFPLTYDGATFFYDLELRKQERLRRHYGDDDVVILAAGRFEKRKRLDWLLNAFERLSRDRENLRLLLVGLDNSEATAELRRAVEASPVGDKVRIEGFLDSGALNGAFNAADIGVWPKQPAITIQQALGTGLRVCLPSNDLVGHLLRGDAGSYFAPMAGREVDSLIETLANMLETSDHVPGSRESRRNVNAWLSVDQAVENLLTEHGLNVRPNDSIGQEHPESEMDVR